MPYTCRQRGNERLVPCIQVYSLVKPLILYRYALPPSLSGSTSFYFLPLPTHGWVAIIALAYIRNLRHEHMVKLNLYLVPYISTHNIETSLRAAALGGTRTLAQQPLSIYLTICSQFSHPSTFHVFIFILHLSYSYIYMGII